MNFFSLHKPYFRIHCKIICLSLLEFKKRRGSAQIRTFCLLLNLLQNLPLPYYKWGLSNNLFLSTLFKTTADVPYFPEKTLKFTRESLCVDVQPCQQNSNPFSSENVSCTTETALMTAQREMYIRLFILSKHRQNFPFTCTFSLTCFKTISFPLLVTLVM